MFQHPSQKQSVNISLLVRDYGTFSGAIFRAGWLCSRLNTLSKLDLQTKALKEAGCDKIFSDIASGAKTARPGLKDAEMVLREGDALVVWKLTPRAFYSAPDRVH